jgi:hypothetical protein
MSVLSPEELRYGSISAFGLIIFTTILKWTGVGQTRFQPAKLDTQNATQIDDPTAFETFMDPSITSSSPFADIIDLVLTPFQFFVDMLLMWSNVYDVMGFASVFIIVPMLIMLVVLAGVAVTMLEAALP